MQLSPAQSICSPPTSNQHPPAPSRIHPPIHHQAHPPEAAGVGVKDGQQQAATGSFSTQMMSGGNASSQQMSQSTTVQNPQSRSPDKSHTAGVGSKRGGGGGNFTGLIHGSNA